MRVVFFSKYFRLLDLQKEAIRRQDEDRASTDMMGIKTEKEGDVHLASFYSIRWSLSYLENICCWTYRVESNDGVSPHADGTKVEWHRQQRDGEIHEVHHTADEGQGWMCYRAPHDGDKLFWAPSRLMLCSGQGKSVDKGVDTSKYSTMGGSDSCAWERDYSRIYYR